MYAKDIAIRVGQSVTVEVSNRPYVDRSIPPQSNDFRWADLATIEIHDPEDNLIVSAPMEKILERPGWYSYTLQTQETWYKGIYRVVIRLTSAIPSPSGSPGTSATSGAPTTNVSDVKVSYFRLMDLF